KTEEHITLVAAINELGFEVIPCFYYFSCGLYCYIIESSSCYGEYVYYRRLYDGSRVHCRQVKAPRPIRTRC
ncbi:hypothetical protein MYCTH_83591, partial [Thermothelomyces thermophilus ATCC 42464]